MKISNKILNLLLYIFLFSLNFEQWDPFNTGVDFIISKVTISIYIFLTLFNLKFFLSLKHIKQFLYPLLIYFALLTVISYFNQNLIDDVFFDLPLFLNILILILLFNHSRLEPNVLLKGLFAFSIGSILLSIFYLLNFETDNSFMYRVTVLGDNHNSLALKMCISLLTLSFIIIENKLKLKKYRYLLLIFYPYMIKLMIDTGSRVGFITFSIGILIFIMLFRSSFSMKKMIFIISFSIFIFFSAEYLIKSDVLEERLISSFIKGDLSGRDILWNNLIELINKNFLLGVGKTGFARDMNVMLNLYRSPHNAFIEVFYYTGLVGFLIFLIFFIRVFKVPFNKYKLDMELLPLIFCLPIIGMMLSGQIFEPKIAWVLFAFIISKTKSVYKKKVPSENLSVIEYSYYFK